MSFLATHFAENSAKDELIGELHTKLQAAIIAIAEVKHQIHAERVDFEVKLKEMQTALASEVERNATRIGKSVFSIRKFIRANFV